MELRRIETPGISHYAYLIANEAGDALIVDPRRDVDEYLRAAASMGLQIRYIVETHRQEDFVMGSSHLRARTGAKVVNGTHALFGRGDVRLSDGEALELGDLSIQALHTPGHTPESMSYAIFAKAAGQGAWGVLTGDALFFGDTGRTDLTDAERAEENAALLYDMVHQKLAPLGDGTLVLPAHGPGSVCGSGMVALPSSTIGAERRYNRVFTLSREQFAKEKAKERLPRPPYFRFMEEVNLRGGIGPVAPPGDVPRLGAEEFARAASGRLCIDTREPEAFAGGHMQDTYSIWLGGLPVFGGWMAQHDTPIYLLTDRNEDIETAQLHLSRIGVDGVRGALAEGFGAWRASGNPVHTTGVISAHELSACRSKVQLLDVRDPDEYASGHIPGARNVYVGHLRERLRSLEFDPEKRTVVTCSVGHRASLGVSILHRAGYADVRNLLGGMKAWKALSLPMKGTP